MVLVFRGDVFDLQLKTKGNSPCRGLGREFILVHSQAKVEGTQNHRLGGETYWPSHPEQGFESVGPYGQCGLEHGVF